MVRNSSALKALFVFAAILALSLVAFAAFAEPTVEITPEAADIPQDIVRDIFSSTPMQVISR